MALQKKEMLRWGTAIDGGGEFGLLSYSLDSLGDTPYPCRARSFPCSLFQAVRMMMALHASVFLLMVCLLPLALLWCIDRLPDRAFFLPSLQAD